MTNEEKSKQPAHPEDVCDKCGGRNVVWFAPNELWNAVTGNRGILCPVCFIVMAEAAGFGGPFKVEQESELDRAKAAAAYEALMAHERPRSVQRACYPSAPAVGCHGYIEKDWPGHTAVLWRRDCKRRTRHPSGLCQDHRPSNWAELKENDQDQP